jgi:glycosyltransferase involved in cell wall biosynthesis
MSRMGGPTHEHWLGLIGRRLPAALRATPARTIHFGRRLGLSAVAALPIRDVVQDSGVQLVHAWSAPIAATARMAANKRCPVVAQLDAIWGTRRPGRARCVCSESKTVRDCTTICPSLRLRERAVEAGICETCCGVIRPAADVGTIERAGKPSLREKLGIADDAPVLLTAPPPTRAGGHYYAVWAAAVVQQLWADVRIIVPGVSAEARRLARFAESFRLPKMLVEAGDRFPFEELLGTADVLVFPALDDVPTGAIGAAMTAGVPVVASSVAAAKEYVTDEETGLLCDPAAPVKLAACINRVLCDKALAQRLSARARERIGRDFDPARLVNDYHTVYDNLLNGRKAFDGMPAT